MSDNKEGAATVAPSTVKKESKKATTSKPGYKEITVRASRRFTVLPKQVQDETRTKIGAFSLPDERSAFRSLSDDEVSKYGSYLLGITPKETGYAKASNEYFNDFSVIIPFEEGVKIKVPVDEKEEAVLNESTKGYILDIMRYRHVTNHPRVAKDFAQWEEATHLYVAYIEDSKVIKQGSISQKDLRKKADRAYLEIVDSKEETKMDWILEVLRRGVKTTNLEDPPAGYTPLTLVGVVDVVSMPRDDKELALEEFKIDRLREFMQIVGDEDLEWRALLERGVQGKVLERRGNVVLFEREVLGADDSEAVAQLKAPSYSENLVVIKQKIKNAFK